ncbi:hypothetical protein OG342_06995 [Streptomyces bobili]|nr:hypothetical protein [Streptomyces bobili]MCX5522610.1 hypothetical protein [Streptomyces bobili]
MNLFSRKQPEPTAPVDMDIARRAGEASNPRAHAFASFRFINTGER